MEKPNKLTEILNQIKPLNEDKFRELMIVDLNKLNADDECLKLTKENITDAADAVREAYCLIKKNSGEDKKFLRDVKEEILNLDPEIVRLSKLYNKVTGYDSPDYLKYAHFSTLAKDKIKKIETDKGGK